MFKSGEHGYALIDAADQPRPTYGAYWLYARYFGDQIVHTEGTALTTVNAHSALRSDGALTVVLINKSSKSQFVHLDVQGTFCAKSGEKVTLAGDDVSSTGFTMNGEPFTSATVGSGVLSERLADDHLFDVAMSPASMTMIVFEPD